MKRAEGWFVRANEWLVALLLAATAVLLCVNVVARYVFQQSLPWTDEVSRYLMIWGAYLGIGLAMREGRHVSVEMLQERFPGVARRWVRALVAALMLGFMGLLAVLGVQYSQLTLTQQTPVLGLSLGVMYLAIPVGAALFGLHLLTFVREYVVNPGFALSEVEEAIRSVQDGPGPELQGVTHD